MGSPTIDGAPTAQSVGGPRNAPPQSFNVRAPDDGFAILEYKPDGIVRSQGMPDQIGAMSTETYGRNLPERDGGTEVTREQLSLVDRQIDTLERELARRGSTGDYNPSSQIRIARNGQTWDQATPLSREAIRDLREQVRGWREALTAPPPAAGSRTPAVPPFPLTDPRNLPF